MAIDFMRPPDDRIVVMGMSCSGKTTFAAQLQSHQYFCFDALFPWHEIETFGLSISEALSYVSKSCKQPFVLDGWHLADREGRHMPCGATVYVVYAPYQQIVDQYRVSVYDRMEYLPMFRKWYYDVDYVALGARYFNNRGDFAETTGQEFKDFLEHNR